MKIIFDYNFSLNSYHICKYIQILENKNKEKEKFFKIDKKIKTNFFLFLYIIILLFISFNLFYLFFIFYLKNKNKKIFIKKKKTLNYPIFQIKEDLFFLFTLKKVLKDYPSIEELFLESNIHLIKEYEKSFIDIFSSNSYEFFKKNLKNIYYNIINNNKNLEINNSNFFIKSFLESKQLNLMKKKIENYSEEFFFDEFITHFIFKEIYFYEKNNLLSNLSLKYLSNFFFPDFLKQNCFKNSLEKINTMINQLEKEKNLNYFKFIFFNEQILDEIYSIENIFFHLYSFFFKIYDKDSKINYFPENEEFFFILNNFLSFSEILDSNEFIINKKILELFNNSNNELNNNIIINILKKNKYEDNDYYYIISILKNNKFYHLATIITFFLLKKKLKENFSNQSFEFKSILDIYKKLKLNLEKYLDKYQCCFYFFPINQEKKKKIFFKMINLLNHSSINFNYLENFSQLSSNSFENNSYFSKIFFIFINNLEKINFNIKYRKNIKT